MSRAASIEAPYARNRHNRNDKHASLLFSQAPLSRYAAWDDAILDIVMHEKLQNERMYPSSNFQFRDTAAPDVISMI